MIGKAGVLRKEEAAEKCSDHAFLKGQKFKLCTQFDRFLWILLLFIPELFVVRIRDDE